MEELKNIRNFEKFKGDSLNEKLFIDELRKMGVDSMNEELLWDAVKNLFKTIFGKMDKKLADNINNFTRKIDGAKSYEEAVKFFLEDVANRVKYAEDIDDKITGPLGLRKVIADLSDAVFISLQVMVNKYQNQNLAPKNIFKGHPQDEKMFSFDKSDDFKKNLLTFVNAKIIALNKSSNPPAYDDAQLNDYLIKNPDIDSQEALKQLQGTPTAATAPPAAQSATTNVKQNLPSGQPTEKYNYGQTEKLFEAEAPATNPAAPATNPAAPATNPAAPATNPAAPATTPAAPNAPPQGNIKTLVQSAMNWISNSYNFYIVKKIKEIKPVGTTGGADQFDIVAKGSKATSNPQNLAKLLRNIVSIQDAGTLAKVRDAIATTQGKNPEDFKNEIGVF
jgi:hypothetical protein